jgi:hypothetical protein
MKINVQNIAFFFNFFRENIYQHADVPADEDGAEQEHVDQCEDVLDVEVEVAEAVRVGAVEVPHEVGGLRHGEEDDAGPADGRDQPVDEGAPRVGPILLEPNMGRLRFKTDVTIWRKFGENIVCFCSNCWYFLQKNR